MALALALVMILALVVIITLTFSLPGDAHSYEYPSNKLNDTARGLLLTFDRTIV